MKKKNTTIIAITAVAILAACIIIGGIVYKNKSGSGTFRSIQIYQLNGQATIEREKTGTLKATENLMLQSGDDVSVKDESSLRLKMDEDKYALVEENSEFGIVAEGTPEDSKTYIELRKGAITSEIKNKLNSKSTYEVTTPNSVMAVRGTVFRVEVTQDENGSYYVTLDTFEGEVIVRLIHPDGSIDKEEKIIKGGKQIVIYSNDKISEYLGEITDINYEELPLNVLEFLLEIMEDGRKLEGITKDDLQKLIDEKQNEPDYYEVTFLHNGSSFAAQQVEPGNTVSKPKLVPSNSGDWDFDFSKKIHKNTTIEWK